MGSPHKKIILNFDFFFITAVPFNTLLILTQERIPFIIIEKSSNIGGTWWDNTYPGCRCDISSHLYSLSFKPNPFWSRSFPDQKEILAYLEDTFEYYGINQHVKLNTKVERCKFNMVTKKWTVFLSDEKEIECNFLISGKIRFYVYVVVTTLYFKHLPYLNLPSISTTLKISLTQNCKTLYFNYSQHLSNLEL